MCRYNEQPDSNNRSDEIVAMEWWRNHLRRDLSIITALFTGQFKSSLTCSKCQYESSRFEPFSFLPVPLPENPKRYQRVVFYGYGTVPLQLSIAVQTNSTIQVVLEELCHILNADRGDEPKVQQKDVVPVIFDAHVIGDILPGSTSLAGFDYGHSVIHVLHAPLLGGDPRMLDLTVRMV